MDIASRWLLTHGGDLQVIGFFGLLAALALVERILPRRPASAERRARWRANFGLTAINVVVLSLMPLSFIGAALWAERHGWGLLNNLALPVSALLVFTLLLRAFISFLMHYLMHRVPSGWRLHRVHHLDTDLDVSSTVRFHPLEFVVNTLPAVPLVVLFGLTPWALMLYELLDVAVTLFSHANLRLPAGLERVLRCIVVTPDLHRVHHSVRQPETDSNFGAVFPIWDMVFGTYRTRTEEPAETMPLGLAEVRGAAAHRLSWLLVSPLRALTQDKQAA